VKHKFTLQFFLFISLCLGFCLIGGYLFYQLLVTNISSNLRYEQVLVADRIRDNIESHLERVGRGIDSILSFHAGEGRNIRSAITRRFHLLQAMYPEIGKLALATDNKIFFSNQEGVLPSTGMPVDAVYEWSKLKQRFWWQLQEGEAEATVIELFQFVPAVNGVIHLPVVLFAKKVIVGKKDYGSLLIPYQLEFMVNTFLKAMESDGERPVALVSDQGLVLYSTIREVCYTHFLPAYAPHLLKEQRRKQCSLVDAEFLSLVNEKLDRHQPFHSRFTIGGADCSKHFEGYFTPVNVGGTIWTLMVGAPLPGPYAVVNQVFFPLFWGMLVLIAVIGLVTFWLFRQADVYWQGVTVFKRAVENSGDGIYVADLDGTYMYANHAYAELVGCTPAELQGKKIDEIQRDESPEQVQKAVREAINSGQRWRGIVRMRRGDQLVMELSQSIWPIVQHQKVIGYACSQHDITEEQRMKEQLEMYSRQLEEEVQRKTKALVQAQKMETVGLLAAGFAHDFNNLLAGFYGNIQLLELSAGKGDVKSRKYITKLKEISNRAADLVRRILEFSRKDKGEVVNNSIGQIVQESVELATHSLPKNISISFEHQAAGSIVQVEKAQLMQVLMNIVINARDAIGDRPGGRIVIVSRQQSLEKLAADRLNLKKAGRYVEINISDNGPGMPGTIVDRVFDPFFSTKEWSDSKGTGIGLSIAYTVVHTYDGSIVVDSREGQGTTFRIFLPCVDGEADSAADEVETEIEVKLAGKTILVVEDEDEIRFSLRDLLSRHGARILLAENGQQGQTMIRGRKLDAIILDLNMPEMSGEKFLAAMKDDSARIPVIVITGLSRDGYAKTADFPMVKAVLQKPFNYRTLLQSLAVVFGDGD